MNLKSIIKQLFFASLILMNSACNYQQLAIKSVYSSNHCAINTQTITAINNAAELAQLFDKKTKSFPGTGVTLPKFDYSKQSLVLVALGQKSSSGYSIELYQQHATVKDNNLYLPVRIRQPEKGSFQAQVITSPCQIFSIPKAEFDKILLMETD
jgi:hypothetical protein